MISVRVKRDPGNKEAPSIQSALITDEESAKRIGKKFLDDPEGGGYFITEIYEMGCPFCLPTMEPGNWIIVDDPVISPSAQSLYVKSVIISGTPKKIETSFEARKFKAP